MAIPTSVAALCAQMTPFVFGPFEGRPWYLPRPGVTRAQLSAAGATAGVLRTARILAGLPSGQIATRELGVRIFDSTDVLMAPAGWIGTGTSATARPLPDGVIILGGKNAASASAESDPTDVQHDHFCSSGSNAFAQKVQPSGSLGPVVALPVGTIAGPEYGWRNPTGSGLIPCCPIELFGVSMWPESAPR